MTKLLWERPKKIGDRLTWVIRCWWGWPTLSLGVILDADTSGIEIEIGLLVVTLYIGIISISEEANDG